MVIPGGLQILLERHDSYLNIFFPANIPRKKDLGVASAGPRACGDVAEEGNTASQTVLS